MQLTPKPLEHPKPGEFYAVNSGGILFCTGRSENVAFFVDPQNVAELWEEGFDPDKYQPLEGYGGSVSVWECSLITTDHLNRYVESLRRRKMLRNEKWVPFARESLKRTRRGYDQAEDHIAALSRLWEQYCPREFQSCGGRLNIDYIYWVRDQRAKYDRLAVQLWGECLGNGWGDPTWGGFFRQWLSLGAPETLDGFKLCIHEFNHIYHGTPLH